MIENIFQTNWTELLDVTLRAMISLVTLFLITKMLGKKQVSQLSLFDYVIGISIGNFAAEMTINLESDYLHGILAVVIFGIVAYLVSILTMKSIHLRRYFMGTPTLLIQDGKLLEKNMKKVRYDMNDLLEQCRINGYFDISEIKYAGKIMPHNLENFHKTTEWLKKELKVKGYEDISDILLATLDVNEKLQIYERNLDEKIKNVLE